MLAPDPAALIGPGAGPVSDRGGPIGGGLGVDRVFLGEGAARDIADHGRRAYPEEACGFLVGPLPRDGHGRHVERIRPTTNAAVADRSRRYRIVPADLHATERTLARSGASVLGFYHSHPDRPARPSAYDERRAWTGYCYLILAVGASGAGELAAFELDGATGRFRALSLGDPRAGYAGEPATPASAAEGAYRTVGVSEEP